jgi:hypothetical protein
MAYLAEKLQFGNLEHILFVRRVELRSLEGEKKTLGQRLSKLREYDKSGDTFIIPKQSEKAYAQISEDIAEIDSEINAVNAAIETARAEMFFAQRRRMA